MSNTIHNHRCCKGCDGYVGCEKHCVKIKRPKWLTKEEVEKGKERKNVD